MSLSIEPNLPTEYSDVELKELELSLMHHYWANETNASLHVYGPEICGTVPTIKRFYVKMGCEIARVGPFPPSPDFHNDAEIVGVFENGGVLISDIEFQVEKLEQDSLTLDDGRVIKRHPLFMTVCIHDVLDEAPVMSYYVDDEPFDIYEVSDRSRD